MVRRGRPRRRTLLQRRVWHGREDVVRAQRLDRRRRRHSKKKKNQTSLKPQGCCCLLFRFCSLLRSLVRGLVAVLARPALALAKRFFFFLHFFSFFFSLCVLVASVRVSDGAVGSGHAGMCGDQRRSRFAAPAPEMTKNRKKMMMIFFFFDFLSFVAWANDEARAQHNTTWASSRAASQCRRLCRRRRARGGRRKSLPTVQAVCCRIRARRCLRSSSTARRTARTL